MWWRTVCIVSLTDDESESWRRGSLLPAWLVLFLLCLFKIPQDNLHSDRANCHFLVLTPMKMPTLSICMSALLLGTEEHFLGSPQTWARVGHTGAGYSSSIGSIRDIAGILRTIDSIWFSVSQINSTAKWQRLYTGSADWLFGWLTGIVFWKAAYYPWNNTPIVCCGGSRAAFQAQENEFH